MERAGAKLHIVSLVGQEGLGFFGQFEPESPGWKAASVPFMRMSIMLKIFSLDRLLKMITSSMRFRNSGEKVRFRAFQSPPLLASSSQFDPGGGSEPTPVPKVFQLAGPSIFDVMMIESVFLKSTFRPRPSVSWPSSSTRRRML